MKWLTAGLLLVSAAAHAAAASVMVSGMVVHPGLVALDSLKSVTLDARFETDHGPQAHSWSGPLLLDILNAAVVRDAPGKKTHLRHVIMAQGADGYTVAIAIGEIVPMGEGKQVIVALTQDGKALDMPRLVVPGDKRFPRGVHELTTLDVE